MTKNLRRSPLLEALREKKDSLESQRVRTSMMLSARIAGALKAKGWNKGQLAKALGKSPSIITRWLSGTHNFTSDTLSDIQQVLDVQLLVRNDNEQNSVVTGYCFLAPQFQGVILREKDLHALITESLLGGGCTTTRYYSATLNDEGKILENLKQG
jgi:transcriptional regulator with XRE-family HTH domain